MKIREKYDSFALLPFKRPGGLVEAFGLVCFDDNKKAEYFIGVFPEGETVLVDRGNNISVMYEIDDLLSEPLTNKIMEILGCQGQAAVDSVPKEYRKALSL